MHEEYSYVHNLSNVQPWLNPCTTSLDVIHIQSSSLNRSGGYHICNRTSADNKPYVIPWSQTRPIGSFNLQKFHTFHPATFNSPCEQVTNGTRHRLVHINQRDKTCITGISAKTRVISAASIGWGPGWLPRTWRMLISSWMRFKPREPSSSFPRHTISHHMEVS